MLHPPILQAREQPAAVAYAAAAFVKTGVYHALVDCPVNPGQANDNRRDQLHGEAPKLPVEQIAGARPPGIESDDGSVVDFIDIVLAPKQFKNVGPGFFKNVWRIRARGRFAPIEPITEPEPGK